MAYMFNGQGFPIEQQLGGTNVAMGYWNNSKQDNPINNLQNLIGNLQYTHQYRGLMDNINPYDGLTAAQKMQQQGIYNDYTIDYMDKLAAAYNAEAENMRAARQIASDFNAEALQAEAFRVKASGDPRQIQAFNNKIARYINAQVASGALTPETAQKIYVDYNTPLAERANIGLTYAQTRQTNANAYGTELANNDTVRNQRALENFNRLMSSGVVTDNDSAFAVGRRLGMSTSDIMAAMNVVNLPQYNPVYGKWTEQISQVKQPSFWGTGPVMMTLPNGQTAAVPTNTGDASQQKQVATQGAVVDSGINKEQSTESNVDAALKPVEGKALLGNSSSKSTSSSPATATKGTPVNASNSGTPPQEAQAQIGVNPTAQTEGAKPSTSEQPVGQTPQQIVNGQASSTANSNNPVTPEQLQSSANNTNANTNTNLNTAVEQAVKNSGGAVIKPSTNGYSRIDSGKNILYNPDTGELKFSENVPIDKTDTMAMERLDFTLQDINRSVAGKLRSMYAFNVDRDGNVSLDPTTEMLNELQQHPEYAPKIQYVHKQIMDAIKPVLDNKNNLAALTSYLQGAFGASEAISERGKANYNKLSYMSSGTELSNKDNAIVEEALSLGGSVKNIYNTAQGTFLDAANALATSNNPTDNYNALNSLVKNNPGVTATNLSKDVDQATAALDNITNDINTVSSTYTNYESAAKLINKAKELGGSATNILAGMASMEDEGSKTVLQTYQDNGLVVFVPKDSKTAENTEDYSEVNAKTTAEFLTAVEKAAEKLSTDFGFSKQESTAIVLRAGVVADRGILNANFGRLSPTNNNQYLNMDEAYRIASLHDTYGRDPNGISIFQRDKNNIAFAKTQIENLKTAGTDLKAKATNYSTIFTDLENAGIKVISTRDRDGNIYYNLDSNTMGGLNSSGKIPEVNQKVSDLDKSMLSYIASYQDMSEAVRPVLEKWIVKSTADKMNSYTDAGINFLGSKVNYVSFNDEKTAPIAGLMANSSETNGKSYRQLSLNSREFGEALSKIGNDSTSVSATDLNPNATQQGLSESVNNWYNRESNYNELQKLNKQGNDTATYILGENFELQGKPEVAFRYYKQSAESNNAEAQFKLGNMYVSGNGTKQDYNAAREWYKHAASQGHVGAMLMLNRMYNKGLLNMSRSQYNDLRNSIYNHIGAKHAAAKIIKAEKEYTFPDLDIDLSQKILVSSNKFNSKLDYSLLKTPYYLMRLSPEEVKAYESNLKKVNNNNVDITYPGKDEFEEQQKALYDSQRVSYDELKNIENNLKKPNNNNIPITYPGKTQLSGTDLLQGKDIPAYDEKRIKREADYYSPLTGKPYPVYPSSTGITPREQYKVMQDVQAALDDQKNKIKVKAEDLFNAGTEAYNNKDYAKAVSAFNSSAYKGNSKAQNNLGTMYYRGHGVEQDYDQARKWFTEAAKQGNAHAQNNLGAMYENGDGVPQDYAKALEWYTKAAENGNTNSQIQLGLMYQNGLGVEQDYTKALDYFEKAADKNPRGKKYANLVRKKLNAIEEEEQKNNFQQSDTDLVNGKNISAYNNNKDANKQQNKIQQSDTDLLNGKDIRAYNKKVSASDFTPQKQNEIIEAVKASNQKQVANIRRGREKENAPASSNISPQERLNAIDDIENLLDQKHQYNNQIKNKELQFNNVNNRLRNKLFDFKINRTQQSDTDLINGENIPAYDNKASSPKNALIDFVTQKMSKQFRQKQNSNIASQSGLDKVLNPKPEEFSLKNKNKAVQDNYTKKQYEIGLSAYREGDYTQAFKGFNYAAVHDNAQAQLCLGYMYEFGKGVDQDYKQSAKWYTKAAEQGLAEAQFNLGVKYEFGNGVKQDYQQSYKWYKAAAEQGDASAQFNLGVKYEFGKGVKQNYKQSLKWYTAAAEQGHADAQRNLGVKYLNGQGVKQDYKQALKWFTAAAEQGDATAIFGLVEMYYKGQGVAKDTKKAYNLYLKGSKLDPKLGKNYASMFKQ